MANDNRGTGHEFQRLTQVIEAEKSAQMRLATARARAEAILQEAQDDARKIAIRTDKRIQALHGCFRENLAHKKMELEEAFQREIDMRGTEIGADTIKDITKRLARRIVGIDAK